MGRFRCEERTGADGPLESYRARVGGLGGFDRVFALTCLAPGALARRPHSAEALLRAARAAMTLKDPRIAPVTESGLAPGSAFVASEFVHGVSLQELADHLDSSTNPRALPPSVWGAVIASIGAEIAAALVTAHGATTPVVHGALGLGNVMVTPQGAVKLLDFGLLAAIATPLEIALIPTRAALTAPELRPTGAATATPAPSNGPGGPAPSVERPVDLFALGALLDRLVSIEAPEPPPGMNPFPVRPMPLSLKPLLRSLMATQSAQRPDAAEAEASFRQIVRECRGVDVALEVGTLVRLIMQLRPAPSGTASEPAPPSMMGAQPQLPFGEPNSFGAHEDQPFADEPTAILDVAADGKPSSLAAILLELRSTDEEEQAAAETPTNVPQASFSALEEMNASLRQANAREAQNKAATLAAHAALQQSHVQDMMQLPDSGTTRLSDVPPSMFASKTPAGGIAAYAPPPSPDEAVMDHDALADAIANSQEPSAAGYADAAAYADATAYADAAADADATMVSTEAPTLDQLMAPSDVTGGPFFADEDDLPHGPRSEGAPTNELFGLTSGEIAASLPDPRLYHPAGMPLPAPPVAVAAMTPAPAVAAPATPAPVAAPAEPPEPIFAEFSAAMPVYTPPAQSIAPGPSNQLKRETFTPPHWQPGNVEGPSKDRTAPGAGKASAAARSRKARQMWPLALAAAALAGAIAVALLAVG